MSDKFGTHILCFDSILERDRRIHVGNQGGISHSASMWINNPGVSVYNIDGNNLASEAKQDDILIDLNLLKVDFETRVERGDFGTSIFYKNLWGQNDDLDNGVEEIVCPWGGTFNPSVNIMSNADTFDITYNNTSDGFGTSGALSLKIEYCDSNYDYGTSIHILGNTGMDTTDFSGVGINRASVYSTGGEIYNVNDILFTATTDMTDQCLILATNSVSNNGLYHIGRNRNCTIEDIFLSSARLGGGTNPVIIFKLYNYDRVSGIRNTFEKIILDNNTTSHLNINSANNIPIPEKNVIYVTGNSDTNSTTCEARFNLKDFFYFN
jgi:hypothetical protein